MTETFGFKVTRFRGTWTVSLPHQCDSWSITGEDGYHGVPQPDAVNALERFIAEATEALEHLRLGESFNSPYDDDEPGPDIEVKPTTIRCDRWTWICHTCGTKSKATYTSYLAAEDAAEEHDCPEGEVQP